MLFADLKGSMELLADRDPEEARRILDPVLEHMMEAVHHYEGTVNQVMGDGIMALFGAPLAHEDHAVRACYAALRMQESVKRYGESVRRQDGVLPQIRVGLNSGEVVVRSIASDLHIDYTAVGETTHLAARVEQAATPASVLITAATLQLAEGYVQVSVARPGEGEGPRRAGRGLRADRSRDGAVPPSSAGAAEGSRHSWGARARSSSSTRRSSGAAPDAARSWRSSESRGWGSPASSGSSCTRIALEGWLILEATSVSYGKATSYLPVIELLRGYFQIEGRDDTRRIREKVTGKLVSLDRGARTVAHGAPGAARRSARRTRGGIDWNPLNGGSGRSTACGISCSERAACSRSWSCSRISTGSTPRPRPCWTASWRACPARVSCSSSRYRPEYQHAWVQQDVLHAATSGSPGADERARSFSVSCSVPTPRLDELKRLLDRRTEGNPFFLEESVRTLVETRALAGEPGAYRLAEPIHAIQIPASVHAVLAARIDRLPVEEKRLLQAAAVIGQDVPFTLLQAVAEQTEPELRRGLAHLQARRASLRDEPLSRPRIHLQARAHARGRPTAPCCTATP